jgi:hypothetical protein
MPNDVHVRIKTSDDKRQVILEIAENDKVLAHAIFDAHQLDALIQGLGTARRGLAEEFDPILNLARAKPPN